MLATTLALGACASVPRQAYTAAEAQVAEIPGIPNARVFADASTEALSALIAAPATRARPLSYLALSGGGGDGAYGAGVLRGWSETGTRPEFSLVSGVSTGALTAPFAFLGPAYDPVLEDIYTSGVAATLVKDPSLVNVVFGSGLFGDGRLRDLVGRYVTPDLLAAVAAEHAKGRRLLVVTTNLDSKRAMIWNMGAIAASGAPDAAALFRDVLTASASVPAVFPAQLLDVQAAGHAFQELHVDGSVVTPVFTVPQGMIANGRGPSAAPPKADIYVLMNGRIEPDFELVQNDTLSIVEQTVATGSQARSRASLAATYAFARANRIGFHLAYIDDTAPRTTTAKGFDTAYMRSLYRVGYEKARAGAAWQGTVPVAPAVARTLASR
ncbi:MULTISPECIES: patatin-like phospholipase family protein [unclassified Methylobacterium]|uniref:patatin-like phospholipase family protein n=1 Tax=Methylobacterium sp. 2A TaxID=2603816 RepID=UPI001FED9AED|nr:patatin-like phospholipase family protein [Methylobacterium sp. 2A]